MKKYLCSKHKKYKAVKKPQKDCADCWIAFMTKVLKDFAGKKDWEKWMYDMQIPRFENKRIIDMINEGNGEDAYVMIMRIEHGIYS